MAATRPTAVAPQDIVAAVSRGSKALNQDAVAAGMRGGVAVMAVADGVSETGPRSAIIAQTAAQYVVDQVLAQGLQTRLSDPWFDRLFAAIPQVCRQVLAIHEAEPDSTEPAPKSTLIAAISRPEELILLHVGDGAAKLTTGRLIVIRNLLVPHWNDHGHVARSVSAEDAIQPGILRIRPNFDEGEIVLIGTDGAFAAREQDPTLPVLDYLQPWAIEHEAWHWQPSAIADAMTADILEAALADRLLEDDARAAEDGAPTRCNRGRSRSGGWRCQRLAPR